MVRRTGSGMVFDGVNDYVDVTPFPFGGALSVEAYVRLGETTASRTVFYFGDSAGSNALCLREDDSPADGYGRLLFRNAGDGADSAVASQNAHFFNSNTWTHVVATVSSSGAMQLFKDGALDSTINSGSTAPSTYAHHRIGRWSPERFFGNRVPPLLARSRSGRGASERVFLTT